MKKNFFGYYQPSEDSYGKIWSDGLIILDTNVLLDLYRVPETARSEIIALLYLLKDRLWLPYHVGLEFQRQRLNVIGEERRRTADVREAAEKLIDQISASVEGLEFEKRGLGLETEPLLEEIKKAHAKITQAINSIHDAQQDVSVSDPIRDQLDILFEGRIGSPPMTKEDLSKLIINAEERYQNQIPPGYHDVKKDKNPKEATFNHNGLIYERKYGDLIIWRQIIDHLRENQIKNVLFITSDKKDDWWWTVNGRTIGPRPELISEIMQEAGAELFWMYTSDKFLEYAKSYTDANISEQSVSEMKEVALVDRENEGVSRNTERSKVRGANFNHIPDVVRVAVKRWLVEGLGCELYENIGFPTFLSLTEKVGTGYFVKAISRPRTDLMGLILPYIGRQIRQLGKMGNLKTLGVIFVCRDVGLDDWEDELARTHCEDILFDISRDTGVVIDVFWGEVDGQAFVSKLNGKRLALPHVEVSDGVDDSVDIFS